MKVIKTVAIKLSQWSYYIVIKRKRQKFARSSSLDCCAYLGISLDKQNYFNKWSNWQIRSKSLKAGELPHEIKS